MSSLFYSFSYPGYNYVSNSFLDFMREEIPTPDLKVTTQKNHLSTWKVLCKFRKEILYEDLDYSFLRDFETFMLKNGYRCNTVGKHMRHLKRYINLAIKKGLIDIRDYPFRNYKIKSESSHRVFLTPEELQQLEEIKFLKGKQQKVLDMFLFSCYTGLRFSDIVRLDKSNFLWEKHILWLVYSSRKTHTLTRMPLNLLFGGRTMAIYLRYSKNQKDTLFDVPPGSNSNVNKILKGLSHSAAIFKPLSFHVARHTFATILLYEGLNITTIQRLLGHRSIKTTEIYSKVMEITVIKELKKIYGRKEEGKIHEICCG